jgi:hypothetical protein
MIGHIRPFFFVFSVCCLSLWSVRISSKAPVPPIHYFFLDDALLVALLYFLSGIHTTSFRITCRIQIITLTFLALLSLSVIFGLGPP